MGVALIDILHSVLICEVAAWENSEARGPCGSAVETCPKNSEQTQWGGIVMSDRTKLTLASLIVLMLPYVIGYSLSILILTAIMSTAIDLAKQRFSGIQVFDSFSSIALRLVR